MLRRNAGILLILVAALAVRCGYVAANLAPDSDTRLQGELAHNLIQHGRWFETEQTDPPAVGEQPLEFGPTEMV